MNDTTKRRFRVGLFILLPLLAAAAFWHGAWLNWDATGFGDWQYFHHQWEAAYASIFRYGELPIWDPYHCGGVFLFGDPQAQVYSPFFYLLLPLGTTAGLKVLLILHTAAGFAGMVHLLRRHLKTAYIAAALGAVVFVTCGFFAWHLSGGHASFLPFYLTPWLVLAWRRAVVDPRYSVGVAALMALTLYEGGVYPFAYFTLLIGFEAIAAWHRARQAFPEQFPSAASAVPIGRKIVRAGGLSVALTLLLGAFRLLPVLHTMKTYPRPTDEKDIVAPGEIWDMLTATDHPYRSENHEYVWAEYGTFIGFVAVALAVCGWFVAWRRRERWVVSGAVLFSLLAMGHFAGFSPWAILHGLPIFGSLRVPSRFIILAVFFLAIAAALALDALGRALAASRFGRARLGIIVPVLVLLGVTTHIQFGHKGHLNRWVGPEIPPFEATPEYHLTQEDYGNYATFPARGVSHGGCYTGMTYPSAPGLWWGQRPQAKVPKADGKLVELTRTGSTMTAKVSLRQPGSVTFNQTWAAGWQADLGVTAADERGLIVVRDIPAGDHELVLVYRPPTFGPALALTLVGVVAAVLVGWGIPMWRKRRRPT